MKIYVLSHEYCYGDYKYKYKEECRFIGVYLTKKEALNALNKLKKIRGFSSHLDGFYIDKTEINQLEWLDGYSTGYCNIEEDIEEKDTMKIYVLSHSYECNVEKTKDEARILGTYLTRKEAIKKVEMYKKIRGFSSHISNFYIGCYTIDKTLKWLDNYYR